MDLNLFPQSFFFDFVEGDFVTRFCKTFLMNSCFFGVMGFDTFLLWKYSACPKWL